MKVLNSPVSMKRIMRQITSQISCQNMSQILTCICILFAIRAAVASEDPSFLAKIFDQESKKQKLLFTYQHESEVKNGVRTSVNTYKDAEGAIAAVETVEFTVNGDTEKVRSYRMSQKQLGAEGSVEIKDGQVNFSYSKDGSTKTNDETLTDDFVVGPSVSAYLRARWAQILAGNRVKVRFAVPDRRETVGFEYYKDREETIDGNKAIVVKMKPSSFLIAALVKPLYFFYSLDGKQLFEVHGRTQVKQKVDGSWRDLDAVTVYDYASSAVTAPVPSASPVSVVPAVPAQTPAAGGNSK